MKRVLLPVLSAALMGVAVAPAQADSAEGARIVTESCASCHAVGADAAAKSPDPKAPRFIDVANMPSTTELSIKVFLRSSHKDMPNFILSPEEVDAVTAYLLGLKKK